MMTFMARLLHTPPSRFSSPSTVPLEVAEVGRWGDENREKAMQGSKKVEEQGKRDIMVNEHVHNTENESIFTTSTDQLFQ